MAGPRVPTFGLLLAAASLAGLSRAEEPITITVQGHPEGELAGEPFAATSRVQRQRLVAPALRAPDVLRSEAGVQIAEAGGLGAPATVSIRGATAAQTPVYLGSVRLNDQVGGVADLSTIPLWLVDHIDIYRGNAPFETAELGMGGAIFFEPRRPRKPEAAAGVTLGSFGTRSGFGYLAAGDDSAGMLAGVSAERAENDYPFSDDRGTLFQAGDDSRRVRSNADSRLRDGWLLLRVRPSERSRLEFLGNAVSREQGAPKLALLPSRQARAELDRKLAALTARIGLDAAGESLLMLRSSLLDAGSRLDDPARELGTLSEETTVRGRRIEQAASLRFALGRLLDGSVGTLASFETLERRDGDLASAARANVVLGAARLGWQVTPALSLFALGAAQCRATQPGSSGCRQVEPTGRLGLGVRGSSTTAFVNVSRYQREPALGELYGAGVLVRGNPELRPELGLGADAGARTEHGAHQLSFYAAGSAFVRAADDLVTYARAAQGYVVPLNVGSARVSGVELSAGARAWGRIHLDCAVTLLDPRDTTAGRRLQNDILPFTSRLVLAPRLLVTTGDLAGPALGRADAGLDLTYLSNRFADAAGLIVIPEQTTLGLSAALTWFSGTLITRARLANALDTSRFDIVGYPLPGRSLYISAEVHAE